MLDEQIAFLQGPLLKDGEHDAFFQPQTSRRDAPACTNIAPARWMRAWRSGSHGLPLMGTGDWNDGMNRVGEQGKGESVWLGWFLHDALPRFMPLCRSSAAMRRASRSWLVHMTALQAGAGRHMAGTAPGIAAPFSTTASPLGSASNRECRIDSIAQSWA